jgi:dihydroneopterin aldolase
VDGPQGTAPVTLALWLAETLGASGLIVHGDIAVPAGSRIPVTRA